MPSAPRTAAVAARLAAGVSSASGLMQALNISQTTVSRALRELERQRRVLRIGAARGARYGLRRAVEGGGSEWPIYRIDERGTPREVGTLCALQRDSYYVGVGPERIQGLFEGVPYYLQDARPTGFLGRAVPGAYPELGLPARVGDWTDEHFLIYLTRRASDTTGDLIVGTEALNRHLEAARDPPVVSTTDRAARYPELASSALAGKAHASSPHGEQPKFTVCTADGERRAQVLVKFSPPRSSPAGQRWADLLRSEFIAHRVLEQHGITASRSNLWEFGEVSFLECERFDRSGAEGRRGVVSLLALDTARYGKLDSWTACAGRLAADALLTEQDAARICLLDAFGALIANTDRHFGNLSLFDHYRGRFELAPVYDMLPMLFAPHAGQIVARQFEPAPMTAAWLSVWSEARSLAQAYWERLAQEPQLSEEFRRIAALSLAGLRTLPRRGAGAI